MARNHFAQFMASPQFNHNCDGTCKVDGHQPKTSILEKLLQRIGKK